MFIWKAMAVPEKKAIAALFLFAGFLLVMIPSSAKACSCVWKGPFLVASQDAPLVVIGKIIRHHPGKSPTMDVLVLETLKGGILDSGMVVQMEDGMYCRPTIDVFPTGTKWILAINGQGAKPGAGLAISHCGEYWLRVEEDYVVGSIDGDMKQVKRMSLREFKNRFLYPKFSEKFSGRIEGGKHYRRNFGSRFEFILEPMPEGWQFLENPSECVNRPYNADAGPINPRKFIFSPEVGKRIAGPDARMAVTDEEIKDVLKFGRGELTIEKFKFAPGKNGCQKIEWMDFSVQLDGGY